MWCSLTDGLISPLCAVGDIDRLNDALQSVYLWSIAKMMKASGVDVHYYGEKVPKGRNAIVLSNHLSYLDPFTLFTFALGRGRIG